MSSSPPQIRRRLPLPSNRQILASSPPIQGGVDGYFRGDKRPPPLDPKGLDATRVKKQFLSAFSNAMFEISLKRKRRN